MRKILLLLTVGVLMVGTVTGIEGAAEYAFQYADSPVSELFEDSIPVDPDPCGEGGNGAPPVPG